MKNLKKYLKSLIYIIGIILISTLIITILNYFNIINGKSLETFKLIILIVSLFIGGFIIGKKSNNKGWANGLKLGLIVLVINIIFNYLAFNMSFTFKNLIYYLINLASTTIGSIIGINFKKNNK